MKRQDRKRLKEAAQDILIVHIQNAHDFLEEWCSNRGQQYTPELQETLRRESARLARLMGFDEVPGILNRKTNTKEG